MLINNDDLILTENGEVKPMPARNKACPCNSKNRYKKCCMGADLARKEKFLNKDKKKNKADAEVTLTSIPSILHL